MTVRQLLASVSSRELSEWRAYELKNGPLSNEWRDNALAHLVDVSYLHAHMYGEVNYSDTKTGAKGPIPAPTGLFPRPEKSFYPDSGPTEEEIALENQRQIDALNRAIAEREDED